MKTLVRVLVILGSALWPSVAFGQSMVYARGIDAAGTWFRFDTDHWTSVGTAEPACPATLSCPSGTSIVAGDGAIWSIDASFKLLRNGTPMANGEGNFLKLVPPASCQWYWDGSKWVANFVPCAAPGIPVLNATATTSPVSFATCPAKITTVLLPNASTGAYRFTVEMPTGCMIINSTSLNKPVEIKK
jgi:hypothetical protein